MPNEFIFDNRGFQKALKKYLEVKKNVDAKVEIRRRAKNIGMRLIQIYKTKGLDVKAMSSALKSLGNRIRVREKIKAKGRSKGWSRERQVKIEIGARKSAKAFTATGWFPAVEKLGGKPKDKKRVGPRRGSLIEKLTGALEETLINSQPGAAHVATKNQGAMQQAINKETEDMIKYIMRKLDQAARSNGL